MRKSEIIIGSAILGVGLLLFVGAILNIDIWGLICPAALIALGIWLIYRTRQDPRDGNINIKFVGDVRRQGPWQPKSEETWGFVLDSRLDFTEADIPDGETVFRVGAFVNDIKATIPTEVGVAIYSMAFMTNLASRAKSKRLSSFPFRGKAPTSR